jgi:membrane associated rhomboid family serine protease
MSDSRTETEPAMTAPRERAFNIPGVVMALAALMIAIHLVRAYWLTTDQDIDLIIHAAFIPIRYTGGYELDLYAFTSPITYGLLHGGFEHLIVNLIWLVAFGSPLAQRLGALRFLIFALASSLAAVLLHFVLHANDAVPLIGASGAVAGMMGAATRFAFRIDRSAGMPGFTGPILPIPLVLRQRGVLIFLLVWMAVNLVTGLYSLTPGGGGIAWEAHVGGFLLGFFGIALFDRIQTAPVNLEMPADTAHDGPELEQPLEGAEDGEGRNMR